MDDLGWKRGLSLTLTILLALVVTGGVCITLAAFAGRWWWMLDLAANFRPHLAVSGAAVLIACVALRRRRLASVAAGGVLVNLATIAPLYLPPTAAPPSDGVVLRLMHLNVWEDNRDHAAIARAMQASDADVIFLQEEIEDALMADLIGKVSDYAMISRSETRRRTWGLTMWARRKADRTVDVMSTRYLAAEEAGTRSPILEAVVRVEGVEVPLLSVHPPPPMRSTMWADRNAGLAAARLWAAGQDRPSIVIGDFNSTPWTHGFRLATAGGHLVNSQRGHGLAVTWPAGLRWWGGIPIDHCLHSPTIATLERRVGAAVGEGDHLPLHVALMIPRRAGGK